MTQNPSKIPLPANKTIPKSLSDLSLSDLQSPSKASSAHDSTSPITPIGVGGRRLSLINGHGSGYPHNKSTSSVIGRTNRTSKRESISENIAAHSDDPGKTHERLVMGDSLVDPSDSAYPNIIS